jgi:hypothetical protein
LTNEHLQGFIRMVDEWISVYRAVGIAGRLPGTDRRAELEKIMWQALQEIVEYSKSEEAARNAEERRHVMELLNHAVRAELAVLHEQDAFYVEELVEKLETLIRKTSPPRLIMTVQFLVARELTDNEKRTRTMGRRLPCDSHTITVPLRPFSRTSLSSCAARLRGWIPKLEQLGDA